MRMKALSYILALSAFPAFLAQGAEKAEAVAGVLFSNNSALIPGVQVQPKYPESFREPLQAALNAIQKLSPEKREAIAKSFMLDQLPDYNPDIWPNKADYDRFVEEMKKVEIRPVSGVGVGMVKSDVDGTWRVLSTTLASDPKARKPLLIGALRYDSDRNVWISGNGELEAKEYSAPSTSIYGAQTGTEWVLEKKDSLTELRETIRLTRTTDGKNVYLAYSLIEQSAVTGANIAQGVFLLQFPAQRANANLGAPGQR